MSENPLNIHPKLANQLSNFIVEALCTESAKILPEICKGLGLKEGTFEEAYLSKKNYINARIRYFSPNEITSLALKLEGKYPESELEQFLSQNGLNDGLILILKFENIKGAIIQQIQKANYLIWIAIAWFTDKDLANELYKKSKEGVNVQIILNRDRINNTLLDKLNSHFELYEAPLKEPYFNLMHNKFCIIDLQTVIHGSYNWTNKAQYNDETISIIENSLNAKEFADQFIKIKRKIIEDRT